MWRRGGGTARAAGAAPPCSPHEHVVDVHVGARPRRGQGGRQAVGDRHDARKPSLDVFHDERGGRPLADQAPVRRVGAVGEQGVVARLRGEGGVGGRRTLSPAARGGAPRAALSAPPARTPPFGKSSCCPGTAPGTCPAPPPPQTGGDEARVGRDEHAAVRDAHGKEAAVLDRPAPQVAVVVGGEHGEGDAEQGGALGVRDLRGGGGRQAGGGVSEGGRAARRARGDSPPSIHPPALPPSPRRTLPR